MKQHLVNSMSFIYAVGFMIFVLYFFSVKNKHQDETDTLEIALEEKDLLIEKFQEQNKRNGGFVLLNEKINSVKFENFEGEVIWYRAYDLEKLKSEYSSINFHPIKTEEIISRKNTVIPENACAFLLKGKANGNNYSIVYSYE